MQPHERVELAVRRTRARMMADFPQNKDVLLMLEYLRQELARLSEKPTEQR